VAVVVASAAVVVVHADGTGGRSGCSLGRRRHDAHCRHAPPFATRTGCSPPAPVARVPRRRRWLHAGPATPPGRLDA
jgi:hypothetical protein